MDVYNYLILSTDKWMGSCDAKPIFDNIGKLKQANTTIIVLEQITQKLAKIYFLLIEAY